MMTINQFRDLARVSDIVLLKYETMDGGESSIWTERGHKFLGVTRTATKLAKSAKRLDFDSGSMGCEFLASRWNVEPDRNGTTVATYTEIEDRGYGIRLTYQLS